MTATALKFFKVSTLPTPPLAGNAFYLVLNGDYCETYLTDISGVAKHVGNSAMITQMVATAFADYNAIEIVDDIPDRNALGATLTRNALILVIDATGDPTVASGAAMYAYVEATQTYRKVYEMEGIDFTVSWNQIQGRPTSSVADIDDAVAKRHTHTNKVLLDALSNTGDTLEYSGVAVLKTETTNW